MYASDVTNAQKQSLEREIETMRRNLREEKISVQKLQPLLQAIRKATSDERLDAREVEWLEAVTRNVNQSKKHV